MNSLAQRFSNNGPLAQIGKATSLVSEDDDFSDATWGSEAGFGSLAKGIPTFTVPNVPDVRYRSVQDDWSEEFSYNVIAHLVSAITHR